MTSSPAIQLENISRRFDDVLAVDDVSFSVNSGSVCAVLGGNGAGKTTLLSMLLGLLLPTAGRLSVERYSRTTLEDVFIDVARETVEPPVEGRIS
jgi:ABC-type multidrug transport system ATPase subunit